MTRAIGLERSSARQSQIKIGCLKIFAQMAWCVEDLFSSSLLLFFSNCLNRAISDASAFGDRAFAIARDAKAETANAGRHKMEV
jgi:hypothetical protein